MSIEYPPIVEPPTDIGAVSDAQSLDDSRARIIVASGLVVIGVICLVARLLYPFDFIGDQSHGWFLDHLLPRVQRVVGGWSLGMMLVYPLALLAIFMLERFFPAVPTQKTLSTSLVNDAIWIVVKSVIELTFFTWYTRLLYRMYVTHLSFLYFPLAASLPVAARLVIGFVVSDLLQWTQHVLHHKVKWLWAFHSLHHSQPQINVFSDYRDHFMEYVVRRPIVMLPMMMLGLQEPAMLWWLVLATWHTRLCHSNVRGNFGWLRYVIVTPQSHRIHHSIEPAHIDHNYGAQLTIWDFLFGTQVRDYDVYPRTGIDDEHFPVESAKSVGGMVMTVFRQIFYPFQRIWMMARGN